VAYEHMAVVASRRFKSAAHKAVMLALANRANKRTMLAWPSMPTLAAETQWCVVKVRQCVRDLERDRIIVQTGWQPCATGRVKVWRLDLERVGALPESAPKPRPTPHDGRHIMTVKAVTG
jgi:hypothetical protein